MKKIKVSFIVSFAVALAGIFILSYTLTTILAYIYNYNHYEEVNGMIVGYTLEDNNKKAMVISYTVDNKEYQLISNYSDDETYPVGYGIVVKYDKNHPDRYIIGDETMNLGNAVIGGVLAIAGIAFMMVTYSDKEKKDNKEKNNMGDK